MKFNSRKLSSYLLPLAFIVGSSTASAHNNHYGEDEDVPFEEAQLFFELNNTDGDLGIHGKVDGDEWKYLRIKDPYGRRMLNVWVSGRLKRQGLTEIFFESAEPTFDELDPMKFFRRFPEGTYEIRGYTLDNEKRESEIILSHVLPAPAENVQISGEDAAESCDADELPAVSSPVIISWDAVTNSHPTLGKPGEVEIEYYEVVVENEDAELVMSTMLPSDVTELEIPQGFILLNDEFKFEILAKDVNGNKTAIESCFEVE